jgi:hypothetical protein
VAALGGYLVVREFHWGIDGLYAVMAAALVLYGLLMLVVARRELGWK